MRRGARENHLDWSTPPWVTRKRRGSRAGRAIGWVERWVRIPSGVNAGQRMRLHKFQRELVEVLLSGDTRTAGLQICRGNAKSTLVAALGLWALCDDPDSPQVPLVAHDARHALRTLFRPIRRMVNLEPELSTRLAVYTATGAERVACPWNDGELMPLPADVDRLQGLNPSLAILDEAQTIPNGVLWAVRQGAGKRPDGKVLCMGTPGPDQDSALYQLRDLAANEGRVGWVEHSAVDGCDYNDRDQWHRANPAIRAGILDMAVLEDEARAVDLGHPGAEPLFRLYRLGQWVEGTAGWLPTGTWDACPHVPAPPDGAQVVLGLDGTYRRSTAIVGATPEGVVFHVWAASQATDAQVDDVLAQCADRWEVLEVVHFARIRTDVMRTVADAGIPCVPWQARDEVTSANEYHRAIVDGRVAHDHHPLLGEHMANVRSRVTAEGLRLVRPLDDGKWIDAAMAARMAWWRSRSYMDTGPRVLALGV